MWYSVIVIAIIFVDFNLIKVSGQDNLNPEIGLQIKETRGTDSNQKVVSAQDLVKYGNLEAENLNQFSKDLETWEAPHDIRKNYAYYLSGYDEEGRPILVMEVGRWNYKKIVEAGGETLKNFEKYLEQAFYRLDKIAKLTESQGGAKGVIVIIDFEDFDISQMAHLTTVAHLLKWSRKYRNVIMQHLYLGIGVNSNAVAHTLINFVRPIFGSIMERSLVYGTNKAKWIPQLLKHCPRSQIAPWYGGIKNFVPIQIFG